MYKKKSNIFLLLIFLYFFPIYKNQLDFTKYDIELFLRKGKTKSVNMVLNDTKIFLKNKRLVEFRKNYSKILKNKN